MPVSRPSVKLSEVPKSRGWVVVAGEPEKAWAVAELEWHLHRIGLSTARSANGPGWAMTRRVIVPAARSTQTDLG